MSTEERKPRARRRSRAQTSSAAFCNKPKGTILKVRTCVTARLDDAEADACENGSQEGGGLLGATPVIKL